MAHGPAPGATMEIVHVGRPRPIVTEVPLLYCSSCGRPLRDDRDRLDEGVCYYCGATPKSEPLVTIQLLNEIRNFCGQLCPGKECDMRGTAGAIAGCLRVSGNIGYLRERAGVQ